MRDAPGEVREGEGAPYPGSTLTPRATSHTRLKATTGSLNKCHQSRRLNNDVVLSLCDAVVNRVSRQPTHRELACLLKQISFKLSKNGGSENYFTLKILFYHARNRIFSRLTVWPCSVEIDHIVNNFAFLTFI